MQAFEPSTLYSFIVPSYLVEITFILHIYMKMIKALGILTT